MNHRRCIRRSCLLVVLAAGCRSGATTTAPAALHDAVVEAACGQCQFGLPGDGCDLAIRTGGQAWFVDGTGIDDHGDAHASDGLCNAVRRARASGRFMDGRFHATALVLLPADATAP